MPLFSTKWLWIAIAKDLIAIFKMRGKKGCFLTILLLLNKLLLKSFNPYNRFASVVKIGDVVNWLRIKSKFFKY